MLSGALIYLIAILLNQVNHYKTETVFIHVNDLLYVLNFSLLLSFLIFI